MENAIAKLRAHMGLSQPDFGATIGIGQSHVSALETGYRKMTADLALACLDRHRWTLRRAGIGLEEILRVGRGDGVERESG